MNDAQKTLRTVSAEKAKDAYYEDGAKVQDCYGNIYHFVEETSVFYYKVHYIDHANGSVSISSAEPNFEVPGSVWIILPKK